MPKQYIVFKTTGSKVFYETGDGWTQDRSRAVRFSLKGAAETYMRRYVEQTGNSHYGVVDAEVNTQVLRTLSEADIKKNPKRRKNCIGCKKKSSKSPRGRSKTTRRKNPKRTSSKKSHLWLVFQLRKTGVYFLRIGFTGEPAWNKDKGKALLFKTKKQANDALSWGYIAQYRHGIADDNATAAQIKKAFAPGKK